MPLAAALLLLDCPLVPATAQGADGGGRKKGRSLLSRIARRSEAANADRSVSSPADSKATTKPTRPTVSLANAAIPAFALAATGTIAGAFVAWAMAGGALAAQAGGKAVASALCASYVGGTLNFAAVVQVLGLLQLSHNERSAGRA